MKISLISLVIAVMLCSICYGEELYRIRIENAEKGLVQVSLDKGINYYATGRVKQHANGVKQGFLAADYVTAGQVAATSSHGLRIKVSPDSKFMSQLEDVKIFSIVPNEFYTKPDGFGGHVAGSSGIYTDIPAASSIFANHAPISGNTVYLEENGMLKPISTNYSPKLGDIIVIIVDAPTYNIKYADFENRAGGNVTITQKDGKVINYTKVVKPVLGIGRYDGTTFDENGQINTAHSGVITVDSSPKLPAGTVEGDNPETRGGFMIQPYYHTIRQGEDKPQVMIIGSPNNKYELEGTAPFYSKNVALWYYENAADKSFHALVKIDSGNWEPVPKITGRVDNGLTAQYLNIFFKNKRNIKIGVTDIRLVFPEFNAELSKAALVKDANRLTQAVKLMGATSAPANITPKVPNDLKNAKYYIVTLDGTARGMGDNLDKMTISTTNLVKGVHHINVYAKLNTGSKSYSYYLTVL